MVLFEASVCDTVITLSPSPEVKVIATEKALLVHVVELGEASPAPERLTVNPD